MEFSLFFVNLGTAPDCNWPVRASGYFEAGRLMNLFTCSLVVPMGPFALMEFPLLKPLA